MATPVPFADLADLTEHLNKVDIAAEANELQMHLEAATEAVEGWRNIGPLVTRQFTSRVEATGGVLIVPRTPVVGVDSVTRVPDGLSYSGADLDVDETAGIVSALSGCIAPGKYDMLYQAGRGVAADVPMSLKLAVLVIADHLWSTQRGPTQSRNFAGHSEPEGGAMHRISAGYLIPNRAAHLMQPYASVNVG